MAQIDEPVDVRKGEELDTEKVAVYLKDTIPGLAGEMIVNQFPSGFSNLTYSVKVGEREMILRRPPFGKKPKSGHDMLREYRILKALKPVFRYCPEPLVYTEDPAVMGCPFYVMERIHGLIIRKKLPAGHDLSPADARTLSENLIKVLCELHSVDYKKAGLGDFGKPEGYVRRQVEGWIRQVPGRAHAGRARLRGGHEMAHGQNAGGYRRRPASSTTTTSSTTWSSIRRTRSRSSAYSTGRWRPSAIP